MKKKKMEVIRPWSLAPCPSAAEVREAWQKRRASQKDFIWLLSLLGELTCYTDCNLKHNGGFGNISGRQSGLKGWIESKLPELMGKYKSISRYATLAIKFKKAFNYYPPAPLSLLHSALPKPKHLIPYIDYYAKNLYELYFQNVPPTYVAFKAVIDKQYLKRQHKHKWGPSLPQSKWKQAEDEWLRKYVRPKALAQIKADHEFYSRDFIPRNKSWFND